MADDIKRGDIRAEAHALDQWIQAALADQRRTGLCNGDRTLLLRSFDGVPMPEALIADPRLEPVDKIVWLVLHRHASAHEGRASLPTYRRLAARANVTNRKTVARAITMLRCTRWLTVCARYGSSIQRGRANVFVLHQEPLTVADTRYLDPGYIDFLQTITRHPRKFVRTVARQTLGDIQQAPP